MSATDGPMAVEDHSSVSTEPARAHSLPELVQRISSLGFFLFILLTAALFIRPSEILTNLEHWRVYDVLYVVCLIFSFRPIMGKLSVNSLLANPITVCVVGLLAAVVLSHLSHLHFLPAAGRGVEFSKNVLYYLLLVALVDTPRRLRWFLGCVAVFACVQIGMALLQHHGIIDLVAFRPVEEQADAVQHGEIITQFRICGAGIFHDPNDLGVLAAMTIVLCLYQMIFSFHRPGHDRWVYLLLWLFALGLCAYALKLTQSRGAFLALLAGGGVIGIDRFGWKKCLIAAVILLPLLRITVAGRQTDINIKRTTAQSRLGFWDKGLSLFAEAPVFGIGQGEFSNRAGRVAHNSFVHSFAELGFFGGALFLGAFYLAIWPIFRLQTSRVNMSGDDENSELSQLSPYLLATIVAWTVGMLTLSRSYVPPTYMALGIATVFLGFVMQQRSLPRPRLNGRLILHFAGLSVAFLIGVYLFVRVFHRA